jgi:hypothetical protein
MKKLTIALAAAAILVSVSACKKEKDINTICAEQVKAGQISKECKKLGFKKEVRVK